jgi:hypothetical protein
LESRIKRGGISFSKACWRLVQEAGTQRCTLTELDALRDRGLALQLVSSLIHTEEFGEVMEAAVRNRRSRWTTVLHSHLA